MAFAVLFSLAGYVVIERGFHAAMDRYNDVEGPLAQTGTSLMDTFLRSRRFEKEFLIASRKVGTVESRARYVSLFQTAIEDLRADLARLGATRHPELADVGARSDAIGKLLARYDARFQEVVERRTELGFYETGQEGSMREAAHALEAAIAGHSSHMAALLMMRRAEKDFILRARPRDVLLFTERASSLRAALQATRPSRGPGSALSLLGEYEALFAAYVSTAHRLDIATREYVAAANELEPVIEALRHDLQRVAGAQFLSLHDSLDRTLVIAGSAALLVFGLAVVLGWTAIRRITASTREFSAFAAALARGESGTRLGIAGSDDFGRLGRSLDGMAESLEEKDRARRSQEEEILRLNRDLEARVLERTRQFETANHGLVERNREMGSISELSHVMLASRTLDEVQDALPRFMRELLPQSSGRLYTMNASESFVESKSVWGAPLLTEELIGPDDCWALRRGTAHEMGNPASDLLCAHQHALAVSPPYLCVPLTAQNEGLGLLYIEPATQGGLIAPAVRRLAETAGEQLALGIANMRMREQLRSQSIRDVLTGLYNRRYLEESAERELSLAQRKGSGLAVIMLDVDHFKRFNDAHGHEAGDEVLKRVGTMIRGTVRASDIACRFGGEEFTVLMPGADTVTAMQRADQLRLAARELRVGTLPPVTLSLGVALYPAHGLEWEGILRAADAALYEAKRAGRDRVRLADAIIAEAAAAD